jgi:hypothetical protein
MLPPPCSSSSSSFWLRQEADVVLPMGGRRVGGGWLKRKKPTPSPGQTIASRNLVCSQLRVMSSIGRSERGGTCRPKMRPVCMTSRMTKLDPERLDDRAVIPIEERQPTMSGSAILLFFFRDRNQLTVFVFLRLFLRQLEPGAPLPSPAQLKRKIIIKNKKKHQHHRSHKNVDKNVAAGATALAAAIGSGIGGAVQGNGEIPRPRLEKEESKDSVTEEEDAIINGIHFDVR